MRAGGEWTLKRCWTGDAWVGVEFDGEDAPEGAGELNRSSGQRDCRDSILMDNKI